MTLAVPPGVDAALDIVGDRELTIDDRAAAYAVLHQIQLRINRALRQAKDDLVVHLVQNDLKQLGPISVKAVSFDVEWPCNAEGNWGDAGVQEHMARIKLLAPEYVRHVPDHYEIYTTKLGEGVAMGDPVARQMHKDLREMGWRTEGGKRMTLQVKEAK